MNTILQNMLSGIRDAFVIGGVRDYARPSPDGFAADARALRGDMQRVAQDMRRCVERAHVKSDYRAR
jgi:hypothetical protein